DGYRDQGWTDRVAAELAQAQPELGYRNLGERNLRTAQVRAGQLADALAFRPDLALLACGGNDAMRPGYDPATVDRELTASVHALRDGGADVVTISLLVMSDYPAFPAWFRPVAVANMHVLAQHTGALAAT